MAPRLDILLGNLEDAIRVDNKEAARAGLIPSARDRPRRTALWTRINSLESPWILDDLSSSSARSGTSSVIMIPKVEGPWDIHYVDQLVAQLEAKAGLKKPILFHAILETSPGRR